MRETWQEGHDGYIYKATFPEEFIDEDWKWKPSIHMPREAARIFLRVTNVRVERVQEISEMDAKLEGAEKAYPFIDQYGRQVFMRDSHATYKGEFSAIWDNLNAKRGYGWDTNPWVWIYEFKMVEEYQKEESI